MLSIFPVAILFGQRVLPIHMPFPVLKPGMVEQLLMTLTHQPANQSTKAVSRVMSP
jgi:hypothetical protein